MSPFRIDAVIATKSAKRKKCNYEVKRNKQKGRMVETFLFFIVLWSELFATIFLHLTCLLCKQISFFELSTLMVCMFIFLSKNKPTKEAKLKFGFRWTHEKCLICENICCFFYDNSIISPDCLHPVQEPYISIVCYSFIEYGQLNAA